MSENKNEILDNENSEFKKNDLDQEEKEENDDDDNFASQKIDWGSISVGESQINIDRQWVDLEEDQEIGLKRRNSSEHLIRNFSLLKPEMQKNVWQHCVFSFNFEEFGNKLTLAEISAENIPAELMKFKSKIIRSVLWQNGYSIDKKKLENVPADDSFFVNVINYCIDFSSMEDFDNDRGNKITTLIEELSKWMKGKKLAIDYITHLLFCYYKDTCQYIDSKKKIILCIDFNQNENIDWYCNEIYRFFNLVCDLLIRMKQDNQYIKVYIANLLSYFGYKTEGIENVEDQPEFLSKLPAAEEFYENAKKSKAGLELLRCIKSLGFTLILDKNETFKLEKVDEIDKLIASIGYCNDTELNNWILGINTKKEENRNKNAGDENAKDNYLEIESFDAFKNMKKNSILSFIKNSKNKSELQDKYKILLKEDNQDRLDEVILRLDIVDWMLQNLNIDVFEGKNVQNVVDIVQRFYKYTNQLNAKISSTNLIVLLGSFKEKSLTNDNVNLILEINGKDDGYELEDGTDKIHISYLLYVLRALSLDDKQGIPEKLIMLIMQTIDFESTDLNNDRYYFYGALFFLIRCSKQYNETNPKEAIEDVFNNQNQILNELLKIQNAKDYLNVGVMQKEENFGSKLAYLFVKSGLKISFEDQEKDQINEINENEINENDNNKIEDNNKLSEENDNEDNLKFELKEMDEIDKAIVNLSQDPNLNNWIKENFAPNIFDIIKSASDFPKMKQMAIKSFCAVNEDATNNYQILLNLENPDRLDEVVLDQSVINKMLTQLGADIFKYNDNNMVFNSTKRFYQYTKTPHTIPGSAVILLLSAFQEYCGSSYKLLKLISYSDGNTKNFSANTAYLDLSYLFYALRAHIRHLEPQLIEIILQTINFNETNLNNGDNRQNFYGSLYYLVRCSEKYDKAVDDQKNAIEDVFSDENRIFKKLLEIPNAKDYLNIDVMQREEMYGSKLALLFAKSSLKISFKDQENNIVKKETKNEEIHAELNNENENVNNENNRIERKPKLENNINGLNSIEIEEDSKNAVENLVDETSQNLTSSQEDLDFELTNMDKVEKLIIELSQENDLNNWVKGVNTINEENRNENAGDKNAKDNYLKIESFDAFKNMKKNSILSFIKNSENKSKLQKKYKILLKEENQDRLDEVVLRLDIVGWMLQNLSIKIFEGKDVQNVADIAKKFYKYTNQLNAKIPSTNLIVLLGSFKEKSLTNDNVDLILEINGKDDGYELEGGYGKKNIFYLFCILRSLSDKQEIPENLITLIMKTIDFKSADLKNDDIRRYFYGILFFLIRCSEKYDKNNPKEAIQDVFNGKNKILNELLKIQNAKDYLNVGVMQKEENFGSKLADLFVKSVLKISFEAQSKDKINEINDNTINENDDNTIGDNNELSEGNDDENDLQFELKDMDEVEKLIIELSQENDLNNWILGINTKSEEDRNQNAGDKNAKDNYLKIESFDDFKNMKKNSIVSFIENSKNANELKKKYKILLKEKNKNRLDEVILDINTVNWMLQNVQDNIFSSNDFDEVTEVVKKFYQYTDKPSYKVPPWITINLLMLFKQGSLNAKQILKLLKINNWNAPLDPDDLNHDLNEVWSILSVLGNEEKIPEELLNLIDQTFDFTKVSLDNDDQLQFFYRIVAHLIKHSEDYKPGDLESISFFLDNIVNKSSDHNNGSDGCTKFLDGCTKFLIEIIGKIPSCKLYLQPLISPKDDEKNLIKMFNQSSFAKDKLEIDNQQEISIEGNTKSEKKPDKANNNATEIVRVEQFTAPASIKNEETKNEGYKIENNINFRYELKKNPEKEIVVINDSEMNKLKIENSELKEENKALKEENKTLKNKEKEQLDNLTQMQNKNEKLLPNIDENQKTMEVLNNRIKELEMQNKKLTSEIKQLTEDKEKANNLINESPNVNNQIERLQNEKNNLSNQNNQLLNELEQLKAKISEYKNNQVQEISNVNPKTQSKPNKKLKYTLYIFALIIAVASVAIGFYMSLYAFLGLIVSLILLFVVSCLNSKSQEENNFKLINNNITSMTDRNLLNKYKDINKTSNITQLDLNPNKLKENKGKDGN